MLFHYYPMADFDSRFRTVKVCGCVVLEQIVEKTDVHVLLSGRWNCFLPPCLIFSARQTTGQTFATGQFCFSVENTL